MPIIKPEVQKVLRAAGLEKPLNPTRTVDENLDLAGLSNEAIAEALTRIALYADTDHMKMRALETALRVKGAMKEQTQQMPKFTIVIQNTGNSEKTSRSGGINPILLPRQSLKQEVITSEREEVSEEAEVSEEEQEIEVELEEVQDYAIN